VSTLLGGRPVFEFRQGLEFFLFTTVSRPALEPIQPPMQWVPGDFSLKPGRKAVEVKNSWSYTSTPPVCLHSVWYLVKRRDNCTFFLTFTGKVRKHITQCCLHIDYKRFSRNFIRNLYRFRPLQYFIFYFSTMYNNDMVDVPICEAVATKKWRMAECKLTAWQLCEYVRLTFTLTADVIWTRLYL
jgi:hypothetical protein